VLVYDLELDYRSQMGFWVLGWWKEGEREWKRGEELLTFSLTCRLHTRRRLWKAS
jgi:hypothetical protein